MPTNPTELKACPNCNEVTDLCACLRNTCHHCGKPVGNVTFTVCDDCWPSIVPPSQPSPSADEMLDWLESDNENWHQMVDSLFGKSKLGGYAIRTAITQAMKEKHDNT